MTKEEALQIIDEYEELEPKYKFAKEFLKNDFSENSTEQKMYVVTNAGLNLKFEKREAYEVIRVNAKYINAHYPKDNAEYADFYQITRYPESVSLTVVKDDNEEI